MTEGLWEVLGIAATRDAGAIRKAYAARLKAIKRDLDPQQFQALRDAYERALAQAAEPAGQAGRSAAPPPRSPYSVNAWAHAEPRVVVMPEPSPAREAPVHMSDLRKEAADAPAEPPPRAERRRSTPPRAEEARDDRHRIEEVVRAIEAELGKGDEDAACGRFAAGHDDLAHPLHGVSLAALAGFERAIAELVLRRRAAGQRIGTFAQEAGLRFHWGSRVLDVRAGIDPLADSLAGFAIAEEILRCARGEASHRSPVEASFAKDLTRPADPTDFARSIMKRKDRDSRRQAFIDLQDMPEDPLSWLPSRTVAWWQAALEGPRLFAGPALLQLLLVYAVFAPLAAALAGQTIVWPLVLAGPFLLVAAGATYSLALRQDRPSLGWVRRLGGRFEAAREFLVRTRELPWVGSW
ncbi:MAG TPA: hypothetical protein VFX72_08550, partial [Usitatibacteraceae bacterium]|nr:hypothetical protein [Usitatibacteraceae bacterium]